jgi:tetratricopeptide (TPR) repeat protein
MTAPIASGWSGCRVGPAPTGKRRLLEEGRRNLEVAVGLDSSNALLRSYLGKAYFEEKRGPVDADQLRIAKELDPLDPTPYLYDAIRLQTENRPGEALQAIQKSIELNDNRAIYRSRQGLDQDRAARGTSHGRIYDDLGFQQLGLNEASKSLTLDPGNASAHRFLSDIYSGVRRREIARVSAAKLPVQRRTMVSHRRAALSDAKVVPEPDLRRSNRLLKNPWIA